MTVFKDTRVLAAMAVSMADQLLQGQAVSFDHLKDKEMVVKATGTLAQMGNTGVRTVDTYILAPKVIKKANLRDLVDAGYYTDAQNAELLQ